MKLTFTLLALMVGSWSFASNITIVASKAKTVKVVVDNKTFTGTGNSITIKNITSGRHKLQVFTTEDRSNSSGFFLNRNSNGYWKNTLNKLINVSARTHYDVVITRTGRIVMDEETISSDMQACTADEYDYAGFGSELWDNNILGNQISNTSFDRLRSIVQKESFDNSRLSIIKDGLKNYLVTAEQAKDLGSLFSFEANRLEYAKFVYTRLTNRGDAFMLHDIFTFSASKSEFSDYLAKTQD